jgi:phosphatidylinositol alpha-1,6-mannosyltransferase
LSPTRPDRIRALVLTPDFPPAIGGIQLLMHRLVSNWRNLDTSVVTLGSPGAREFDRRDGVRIFRVPRPPVGGQLSAVVLLNAAAVAQARRFRPDVVLSGHVNVGLAAAAVKRIFGVPYVQYLHGNEIVVRPAVSRTAIGGAAAVISVSRYTADLAARYGTTQRAMYRIPPGVDRCERSGEPKEARPTVISIARLDERYKGYDVLIRAMPLVRAKVPGAHLLVVGDGSLRPFYENLAHSIGLGLGDGVSFLGSVDDETRNRLLERSHVLAMVSRLSANGGGEGFGIVYLEAAVHGLPVVAGNVAGARDAVVDGETGLLVDPKDHVAVAEALTRLLTNQKEAERMARAGAARAEQFVWPRIATRVEELLLEIVAAQR